MRQANKRIPESAEKTVRDIRRATRRSWPLFAIVVAALCASSRSRSLALERRTLDEAEMATNVVVSSKFGTFPGSVAFILLEPSKGASRGSRFTSVANRHPHSNHSSDLAIRRTARLSVTKRCDAWQARRSGHSTARMRCFS
jgi:hypothetical protein